jgi:CBS domain-containing protein
MREAEHFHKQVVSVRAGASAQEVAEQMAREAVGCLVVVDEQERPVGILTDRDLALRVVATGGRAKETTAASVMSQPLVRVESTDPIENVIDAMRRHGIRRVPVTRKERVVGLVSLDDLVVQLGSELDSLGDAVRHQFREARRSAQLDAAREEAGRRLRRLVEQVERGGGQARETLLRELDALRERLRRR